jgi:hypothetical protein
MLQLPSKTYGINPISSASCFCGPNPAHGQSLHPNTQYPPAPLNSPHRWLLTGSPTSMSLLVVELLLLSVFLLLV